MPTVRFGATVDADGYPAINFRDPLSAQEADTLAARNAAISSALAAYATSAAVTAALADKADLVAGKVPTSQLPSLAITDTFTVASQAAMLALSCEVGDVAVRSDTSETYILAAAPATVLGNWVKLATPTDLVVSVNGQQGVVVLNAADVGAAATAHAHALTDVTGLVAALAGKAATTHSHVLADVTGLSAALAALLPLAGGTLTGATTPAPVALTDAATIAINAALGNQFEVTLGGNRTLGNPTGLTDGQWLTVFVKQPSAGGPRTLAYDSAYAFSSELPSPTLSTAADAVDVLQFRYRAVSGKLLFVGAVKGFGNV